MSHPTCSIIGSSSSWRCTVTIAVAAFARVSISVWRSALVRGDTQTLEMRGSWSRGVVLRWILLLLIQSASQEREEAMQKLALKAVLRVIDSVQSEEASLLEEVEERCALEHLGIDSVKEAEPFGGKGEAGWCFWRQEKENDDIISVCRCLLPWKKEQSHPLLLRVLRKPTVLQRVLEVKWGLEWNSSFNYARLNDPSTSTLRSDNSLTSTQQTLNPSTSTQSIAQSEAFLLEYDSLVRLLRHKPSLFPSLSPSFILNHSLEDMNRQLEEAKKEAKGEDGGNDSSYSRADIITFIVIARQLGVVYKTIETIQVSEWVGFNGRIAARRRRQSLASWSRLCRITNRRVPSPPAIANEGLLRPESRLPKQKTS